LGIDKVQINKIDMKESEDIQEQPVPENKWKRYILWFLKNIVALAAVIALVVFSIQKQPGYNWAYYKLLKSHMEFIRKYPKLPLEKRYETKMGTNYSFLAFLKNATPEDAVILYPESSDFFPEGVKSPFTGEIYNKVYAIRFLHPRRLVTPSELKSSSLSKEINFVAIVNGRGFERLNYEVEKKFEHGVLAVKVNP